MMHRRQRPWRAAAAALALIIAAAGCAGGRATGTVAPGVIKIQPPGCARAPALTAAQLQAAYQARAMFARGITGAGTTAAVIMPYASPSMAADLGAWSRRSRLPAPRLQVLRYDGAPDASGPPGSGPWAWTREATQALEVIHLLAPGAALVYVAVPYHSGPLAPDWHANPMYDQALSWLVSREKVTVVSYSSGYPEAWAQPAGYRPILGSRGGLGAAARAGVTVVASAGDYGPTEPVPSLDGLYPRPVIAWPASDPLVTAVGGTRLAARGHGYASSVFAAGGWAGGEGTSAIFPRPPWQDAAAAVTGARRGVADVSMDASPCSPAVTYYTSGPKATWAPFGGTSMAAPLFAGIVADAAQVAGHSLGVLGPALYQMHGPADGVGDVTAGTDTVPGITGYTARPGYDLPTGIGSVSSAYQFTTTLARLATAPRASRPQPSATGSPGP
jgi:kumamolisin